MENGDLKRNNEVKGFFLNFRIASVEVFPFPLLYLGPTVQHVCLLELV